MPTADPIPSAPPRADDCPLCGLRLLIGPHYTPADIEAHQLPLFPDAPTPRVYAAGQVPRPGRPHPER